MGNKTFGECSICGQNKPLTYEHIPPKAANNSGTILYKGYDELFDEKSFTYEKNRKTSRGWGTYSLCAICNNQTGAWYAKDYVSFVKQCMDDFEKSQPLDEANEIFVDIKPHNILKQVISMFMSMNPGLLDPKFKEYLLNKESKEFPEKYEVYMYNTVSNRSKYLGMQTAYINGAITNCSEIAYRPFGFQLIEKPYLPTNPNYVNITSFKDFNYDESKKMRIGLLLVEVNGPFVGDIDFKNEGNNSGF